MSMASAPLFLPAGYVGIILSLLADPFLARGYPAYWGLYDPTMQALDRPNQLE
jgi:hypothetical protein